ncbi:MAG: SAM-dependent methyltransferase [Geodermatophilaceae bacterium]|nr:SAM-dependent methyltransferase [Geodermatophilaceae bacterium]
MERALYGPDGFYVAGEGAAGHFRTSASASVSVRGVFAEAIAELLDRVDAALDHPDRLDLVDMGAGSSDLLEAVLASIASGLRSRVRATVVERRSRPTKLSEQLRWLDAVPDLTGLLLANEWLDNVPIDVVVEGDAFGYAQARGAAGGEAATADARGGPSAFRDAVSPDIARRATADAGAVAGLTVLLVDPHGAESGGSAPTAAEAAWLARWWPSGSRREIGLGRDSAWASAVSRVRRGLAVAIDYAHVAEQRPAYGTLTGFRRGRETPPIPDGSCDLTAHVAIDSVSVAGEAACPAATSGAVRTLRTDQRTALRSLGVSGRRPAYAADPGGYAAALQRASDAAELTDPAGLGAFAWLVQGIELDPTAVLPEVSVRSLP